MLVHEGALLGRSLHEESLDIVESLLRSVLHDGRPHLVGVVLLDVEDVWLVVVVGVKVGDVELSVLQHYQYAVIAVEFAQVLAVSVEVEAQDIAVKPYLASAQRRCAVRLESDALYLQSGEQVTH